MCGWVNRVAEARAVGVTPGGYATAGVAGVQVSLVGITVYLPAILLPRGQPVGDHE